MTDNMPGDKVEYSQVINFVMAPVSLLEKSENKTRRVKTSLSRMRLRCNSGQLPTYSDSQITDRGFRVIRSNSRHKVAINRKRTHVAQICTVKGI